MGENKETNNFKKIHIGKFVKDVVSKQEIDLKRIELFFDDSYENIKKMYENEHLSTEDLLKWSKLLKYDFFRLFSTHLMIYHSINAKAKKENKEIISGIHVRKNLYTPEIKEFIIYKVTSNEMTVNQVIDKYGVGKTTLYRWLMKKEI